VSEEEQKGREREKESEADASLSGARSHDLKKGKEVKYNRKEGGRDGRAISYLPDYVDISLSKSWVVR